MTSMLEVGHWKFNVWHQTYLCIFIYFFYSGCRLKHFQSLCQRFSPLFSVCTAEVSVSCWSWSFALPSTCLEEHTARQGVQALLLLLSNFVETNCILTVSVLRYQTWHLLVFCCSPFTSSVLCIQRWSSADLSCDQELFELLLPFCPFEPALPRYSSAQWIFFSPPWHFSLISRGCA